jgi:hypothetical protein
MTRLTKLNARFLSGTTLSFAEFRQILAAYGFRLDRVAEAIIFSSTRNWIYRRRSRPMANLRVPTKCRQARVIIETHGLRMDEA